MADAVNNSAPARPAPSARSAGPAPSAWSGGAFEAALDQAAARRHALESGERQPRFARRDEDAEPVRDRPDDARREEAKADDKAEGQLNIAGTTGLNAVQGGPAAAAGFTGDVEAMASMMEKAWLAAQADAAKGMQVQFTDRTLALAGFGVMRLADGGLTLQLAAHQRPTPELERALELMRRRLEARGVAVSEVRVAPADPDSEHRPPDGVR
ncbi:hypothetical protein [Brevundimonas diminuta]|uniref:Uncharacterized protein n=1 Tax=Brevundimonas diminuta TaxID=293 RepID=A0A2X1AP94_BREDI|nr:hypothetical protein [Brevundimonas diminuta]SPU46518.1 Uncharacterised protein [Brevundimonas diminuta]